jgi:hypothetical protein
MLTLKLYKNDQRNRSTNFSPNLPICALFGVGRLNKTTMKKPSKAQLEVLKKLNENICILKEMDRGCILWHCIYDYSVFKYSYQHLVTKTFEILLSNKWIKLDVPKSNRDNEYYFITEKGKEAAKL